MNQERPIVETLTLAPPPALPTPAAGVRIPAGWPAAWRHKLSTAEDALQVVKSRQRVYIGGGCGEPLVLARGLVGRAPALRQVEMIQILTAGHAAYAAPGTGATPSG